MSGSLEHDLDMAYDQIDQLRVENDQLQARIAELEQERDTLRAENERLADALERTTHDLNSAHLRSGEHDRLEQVDSHDRR